MPTTIVFSSALLIDNNHYKPQYSYKELIIYVTIKLVILRKHIIPLIN